MSAEIVSLRDHAAEKEISLFPIAVEDMDEELVRMTVRWLFADSNTVLDFLRHSSRHENRVLLIEFQDGLDGAVALAGRYPRSTRDAQRVIDTLLRSLHHSDKQHGYTVHVGGDFQFSVVYVPVAGGRQRFGALLFG